MILPAPHGGMSTEGRDLFEGPLELKHGGNFLSAEPHPLQLLRKDRPVEHHFLVQNHLQL